MSSSFFRLFARRTKPPTSSTLGVGPNAEVKTRAEPPEHPLFKQIEQEWDLRRSEWTELQRSQISSEQVIPTNVKIVVFNRKDSYSKNNNHVWVEFRSPSLVELLRPNFAGLEALLGPNPGIDSRHLYNRRDDLKEIISNDEKSAETVTNRPDAEDIKALKSLVEYIETRFSDVSKKLEQLGGQEEKQAAWDLLWTFCAKGELLEATHEESGETFAFEVERWYYKDKSDRKEARFVVRGRIVQWTGYQFADVHIKEKVYSFQGSQSINRLRIRPLTQQTQEKLIVRGKKYLEYSGSFHHLNYKSNVLTWDPHRPDPLVKYFAEGRVMIDVSAYRRRNPNLDGWDRDEIRMSGNNGTKSLWRIKMEPDHNDICLLPPVIHGWSFRAKKWGSFLIDDLTDISFNDDAFEHLVLPEDYKELVLAFANAHMDQHNDVMKDVVGGKGAGIVMLLHGRPGTGKTLTAEAIADHLQCPLYVVSCSEFGTNAQGLEEYLGEMLETAAQWKSVVLIDEADIFLQARNENIERSALVGVFLRILEYHAGFMILTTNRVSTFDEAVQSRVNIALNYPAMTEGSRKVLWKKFLVMAKAIDLKDEEIFPAVWGKHVEELSKREMNGRQIKNAVRSAQALAYQKYQPLQYEDLQKAISISDWLNISLPKDKQQSSMAPKGIE